MKGKPLLPTLKVKKRYIVYETMERAQHRHVVQAILKSYKEHFGRFGLESSGFRDLRLAKKNRGIIKVNHDALEDAIMALAMVTEIAGKPNAVRSVYVSGILNKAKQKI